ncbi:hypothetical protein GCM10009759_50420 [Kitasatospora saccharophila]|uniref:Uncharacterized protein n=1 Tax=Kitasatospora saccharophila TaxID=407973 RepID=A0ABN2XGD5_9ACTN
MQSTPEQTATGHDLLLVRYMAALQAVPATTATAHTRGCAGHDPPVRRASVYVMPAGCPPRAVQLPPRGRESTPERPGGCATGPGAHGRA